MAKIILINGKKRSGKDWNANLIKQELEERGFSTQIMSFAEPLKNIISETFDISPEDLEKYKNESLDYGLEIKAYPNNQPSVVIDYINFRTILQRFGTEAMKKWFGDDVWLELLLKRVNDASVDYILVPDFRFKVEYIEKSITLKIKNDEYDNAGDLHASETELDDFEFQYYIDNTGYPDTTSQIKEFVEFITENRYKVDLLSKINEYVSDIS